MVHDAVLKIVEILDEKRFAEIESICKIIREYNSACSEGMSAIAG